MVALPVFRGSTVLTFKPGVEVYRLSYHTWRAVDIAWRLASRYGQRELVITSVTEGRHKIGSRHYEGMAFDFRRWSIQDVTRFVEALRFHLGRHYDVVVESTHVHVEYDPKPERETNGKAISNSEGVDRLTDAINCVHKRKNV